MYLSMYALMPKTLASFLLQVNSFRLVKSNVLLKNDLLIYRFLVKCNYILLLSMAFLLDNIICDDICRDLTCTLRTSKASHVRFFAERV